jgi:hypothetical protein
MLRAKIVQQNKYLLNQQRRFRVAADIVVDAWMAFQEVHSVAVIGSVAKALWKEVPRFTDFRREVIELWHECRDLDLALWIESQQRLREIHRAANHALSKAFTSGADTSVVPHQLDIFMFDPVNDAYLGRLCSFNQCPKGKRDCLVPGCGAIAFSKVIDGFVPRVDLLAPAQHATLYRRGIGRLRSALDLPGVEPDPDTARRRKSSETS